MRSYVVEVQTGTDSGAGTDSNIQVKVRGSTGETDYHALDTAGENDFEAGSVEIYSFIDTDVGEPVEIVVSSDGGGAGPAWQLSWIKLAAGQTSATPASAWRADYGGWLDDEEKTLSLEPSNVRSMWLASQPGATQICDLAIPGTHDSATFNRDSGNYDKCQDRTVHQQLLMGCRFVDIRLRWFINPAATPTDPAEQQGNFTIYHGSTWQSVYFDDSAWISPDDSGMKDFPLQDCLSFLQDYPSETVIMQIKKEYSATDQEKRGFAQAFKDLVTRLDPNGTKFYVGTSVPTLEDAKGKIVIVNRDHALGYGYAIDWSWPDADRGTDQPGVLYVEDNYKDTTSDAKEANISRSLEKALSRATGDATWYVTFISCAPGNASPEAWASSMNAYLSDFVTEHTTAPTQFGTVVMDFPPHTLITQLLDPYL